MLSPWNLQKGFLWIPKDRCLKVFLNGGQAGFLMCLKEFGVDTQGSHLPWNRAQRRRHAQATAIVIHLYAGEASKDWDQNWPSDVELVSLMSELVRTCMMLRLGRMYGGLRDLAASLR